MTMSCAVRSPICSRFKRALCNGLFLETTTGKAVRDFLPYHKHTIQIDSSSPFPKINFRKNPQNNRSHRFLSVKLAMPRDECGPATST